VKKELKLRDLCPSARDFIKNINLALAGNKVGDARIGEYTFCKNLNISKLDMDDMAEEDVLSFSWMMKREAKNSKHR
jgi:hypothetical protein